MEKIGIMLNKKVISLNKRRRHTYERLAFYVEIGARLGLETVFFHSSQINFATNKIKGYVWRDKKLVPSTFIIPKVIHNRVLSGKKDTIKRIKKLEKVSRVYNGIVTRNKWIVHKRLWTQDNLRHYLPETKLFRNRAFTDMLNKYDIIYVKPVIGSVGAGVARIEQKPDGYFFYSSQTSESFQHLEELVQFVEKWVKNKTYIIQQGIPLCKYQDRTFDVRVSIQKDQLHEWKISGMVAKLANLDNKLSNLAQGGSAEQLETVLGSLFATQSIPIVVRRLQTACFAIVEQLELNDPSLVDLGLDMGIDQFGLPYFIEANVRDQRYSFFKAGEKAMFYQTYETPLEFGATLYRKKK
ncbi:YheC/YheD family endospore coat-associated protein [Brevibacillus laterosporus]|uniref:YheC/YheD family endospore coat-associated protein n=1 Tax=Brevibacillus laterosporus TaxID=1465 RepID=UPI000E6C3A1A|nr:YheC/YheD family protein [Brevibacillus laterosporus]AYB37370.1 YheC/YheD family protein [Brevibacillus laterosporus]MBM7107440.1 Endospore coat-associated protein YheD [Brevibacillus laterosporus]